MCEENTRLTVECYAGYRGEETPRRLRMGGRSVDVDRILERWQEPDQRWFKVQGNDGRIYVLAQDRATSAWQLVSSEPG